MSQRESLSRIFHTYELVPADTAKYEPEFPIVEAIRARFFCNLGHFDYYIVNVFIGCEVILVESVGTRSAGGESAIIGQHLPSIWSPLVVVSGPQCH